MLGQAGIVLIASSIFDLENLKSYFQILAYAWLLTPLLSFNSNDGLSFIASDHKIKTIYIYEMLKRTIRRYIIVTIIFFTAMTIIYSSIHGDHTQLKNIIIAILLSFSRYTFDALYRLLNIINPHKTNSLVYFVPFNILPILFLIIVYSAHIDVYQYFMLIVSTTLIFDYYIYKNLINNSQTNFTDDCREYYSKAFKYGYKRIPNIFGTCFLLGSPVLVASYIGKSNLEIVIIGFLCSIFSILSNSLLKLFVLKSF